MRYFQDENFAAALLVPYGIVFQEFHEYNPKWRKRSGRHRTSSKLLRMFWIIVSTLVVTSFLGNLKSSFILKEYENSVETLKDIINLSVN